MIPEKHLAWTTTMAELDDPDDVRPDYLGGGIVNLMASILAASGVEPTYAPLRHLVDAELARTRHVVMLVVDGLGYGQLVATPRARTLNRHLAGSITSVFPPTTAAAVTTFLTGLAPQQHGLTGWFTFMRRIGCIVTVLPFTTRVGGVPLSSLGVLPRDLLENRSVFASMKRACYSVAPQDIAHSAFNTAMSSGAAVWPYRTLDELFLAIEHVVKRGDPRSYVYAYWPRLDQLAHAHGSAHAEVKEHLVELDARLEIFMDAVRGTDTLLVLTADHGFMDLEPDGAVNLADHPRLADMLLLPLCGEPRAAYCYVAPSRRRDFVSYVTHELHGRASCRPSADLLAEGWFGVGDAHPELATRIGDYTLLMHRGCAVFDRLPGERRSRLAGVHGGISPAELLVPLVVATL